ncbi:MAG: hypothetical protein M1820_005559 [Bogoriella megaspora]|nr:MAG: hypothetical protein M1820_005559 [Bogoriella megaspora]
MSNKFLSFNQSPLIEVSISPDHQDYQYGKSPAVILNLTMTLKHTKPITVLNWGSILSPAASEGARAFTFHDRKSPSSAQLYLCEAHESVQPLCDTSFTKFEPYVPRAHTIRLVPFHSDDPRKLEAEDMPKIPLEIWKSGTHNYTVHFTKNRIDWWSESELELRTLIDRALKNRNFDNGAPNGIQLSIKEGLPTVTWNSEEKAAASK